VKDLLKLARLDETQAGADPTGIPLQLAPTDPRTLAVDALHDVRALAPTRPVTLTGPDDDTPASAAALADEAALRQVVSNLVGNAIARAPTGSPIRIGVGTSDGHAVLEVADQGPACPRNRPTGSSNAAAEPAAPAPARPAPASACPWSAPIVDGWN
jgi:signal transduction histidine kinase